MRRCWRFKREQEVERLRGERNAVANKMKGKLDPSERQKLIEEGKNLKDELAVLEEDLLKLTDELQQEALSIPNMTHPDVPIGGEDCSALRKMVGSKHEFSFPVRDHFQLGKELDLFDFDAAAEVSGSKFYYLKNAAVILEMALVNWTLSEVTRRGFTPLTTPEIVRTSVIEKCGFQPRAENTQIYSIEGTDQCLIGTAEIPVGGIHMDSILSESSLPLKYVAYSHCFRTEASAAGAATRGLYRVHQFSKVEMFILCRPEDSEKYLEELIGIEEGLFASLGLHFKTLDMASADLGAPAFRKFDIEAWMPGLARYCERFKLYRLSKPEIGDTLPSIRAISDKPYEGKEQCCYTICPHIERHSVCSSQDDYMFAGELPARRRIRYYSRTAKALHGWD